MDTGNLISKNKNQFQSTTVVHSDEHSTSFTWIIENFLLLTDKLHFENNTVSISKGIISDVFTTENSNQEKSAWHLVLWPCIVRKKTLPDKSTESVGLWVEEISSKDFSVISNSKILEAEALLSFIDIHGKKSHSFQICRDEAFKWKPSKDWTNIIERKFLLKNKKTLLPNGSLTIRCDLTLNYKYSLNTSKTLPVKFFDGSKICCDLKSLFEDQTHCDVTICCQSSKFQAHKAILSARSLVFSKMFQNDMMESKTGVVDIQDIESPVMQVLLQYIYCIEFEIPSNLRLQLYFAADKYGLEELKQNCSSVLKASLNDNNVFEAAVAADALVDHDLFLAAKTFVKAKPSRVLSKAYIEFVLKSPDVANRLMG